MELTFVTDLGHSFLLEIDPNMELENVMALLEAEVRRDVRLQTLVLIFALVRYPGRPTKHLVFWTGTE
jgi:hypothetical protein